MPQLASGRRVGLSADPVLELARKGDFKLTAGFTLEVEGPGDIASLINIVYFEHEEGMPEPGNPYKSELMLSDIWSERCDWSAEDLAAFKIWFHSDKNQEWIQNTFNELTEIINTVPPPIPENLKGIFD